MEENKTNINWFPGHMAKTRREIEENLDLPTSVRNILKEILQHVFWQKCRMEQEMRRRLLE